MQVIVLTYIIINSKIQHFNMVLDVELAKTIIERFSIDLDDLQNSNPTTGNNCGGLTCKAYQLKSAVLSWVQCRFRYLWGQSDLLTPNPGKNPPTCTDP